MDDLQIEHTPYGSVIITTTSGDQYRIRDRGGALDVSAEHGVIMVQPRAANAVEVHGRRKMEAGA